MRTHDRCKRSRGVRRRPRRDERTPRYRCRYPCRDSPPKRQGAPARPVPLRDRVRVGEIRRGGSWLLLALPNGSRLSCGRLARRRKLCWTTVRAPTGAHHFYQPEFLSVLAPDNQVGTALGHLGVSIDRLKLSSDEERKGLSAGAT